MPPTLSYMERRSGIKTAERGETPNGGRAFMFFYKTGARPAFPPPQKIIGTPRQSLQAYRKPTLKKQGCIKSASLIKL